MKDTIKAINGIKSDVIGSNGSVPFSNDELKNIAYAAKLNYGKKIKEEYFKEIKRSYKQWLKIILQLCEQARHIAINGGGFI